MLESVHAILLASDHDLTIRHGYGYGHGNGHRFSTDCSHGLILKTCNRPLQRTYPCIGAGTGFTTDCDIAIRQCFEPDLIHAATRH